MKAQYNRWITRSTEMMLWLPPRTNYEIRKGEVHVWKTALDRATALLPKYLSTLSPDEHSRAKKFLFEEQRTDFIVARAFLRTILARYLRIEPVQVEFEYSRYGKPLLVCPRSSEPLFFNLAHAHRLALLAITHEGEIGIDVEYIRDIGESIPDQYFSESEVASLRALPKTLQSEGYFNCWTRKEAYIKAHGEGLSLLLNGFDVSLSPGQPAVIIKIKDPTESVSEWYLEHLVPADGYVGAVAIRSNTCQFKLWEFGETSYQ